MSWKKRRSSTDVSVSEGLGRSKCDFVCIPVDSVDIAGGIQEMFYVEQLWINKELSCWAKCSTWNIEGEELTLARLFHVEQLKTYSGK